MDLGRKALLAIALGALAASQGALASWGVPDSLPVTTNRPVPPDYVGLVRSESLLFWILPGLSAQEYSEITYRVFGIDEEGNVTFLGPDLPPMTMHAFVPPGYVDYGVAPVWKTNVGTVSWACLMVDLTWPPSVTPDSCLNRSGWVITNPGPVWEAAKNLLPSLR